MSKIIPKSVLFYFPIMVLVTFTQARDKSIVKMGNDVVIERSEEVEDAVAIGGDVTVYGTVDENAVAVGGSIYLGPDAVVRGDAVSIGGEIEMEPGAVIYGDIVEIDDFNIGAHLIPFFKFGDWRIPWVFKFVPFIGFLALGVISVLLLPNQIDKVKTAIETDVLKIILYGVMGVVLFVPFILTLAISILGIPLIPLAVVMTILLILFGYFSVATLLGNRTFIALNSPHRSILFQILLGLTILWLVGLLPVLGWIVKCFAYLVGLGGVIFVIINRKKLAEATVVMAEKEPLKD